MQQETLQFNLMFQLNAYKRYTKVPCKGKTMDMDAKTYRLVRSCLDGQKEPKFFAQYLSHQIFGRMHGALNVGKKITNCTVCL
jgi:hypothetical protein